MKLEDALKEFNLEECIVQYTHNVQHFNEMHAQLSDIIPKCPAMLTLYGFMFATAASEDRETFSLHSAMLSVLMHFVRMLNDKE